MDIGSGDDAGWVDARCLSSRAGHSRGGAKRRNGRFTMMGMGFYGWHGRVIYDFMMAKVGGMWSFDSLKHLWILWRRSNE